MTSKHEKHNFDFYEGSSSNGNEERFLSLFKPYHEDAESPFLVLRNEQSDGTNRSLNSDDTSMSSRLGSSPSSSQERKSVSRDDSLEPFAQECLHLFNGEFTVMQQKPIHLQQKLLHKQRGRLEEDLQGEEDEEEIQQRLEEENKKMFQFPLYKNSVDRQSCHPSTFSTDQHLLLKSHGIRFQCRFNEPLFCSIELVDIRHKRRISERIWFHRNTFAMVNDFYEDLEMKRKVKDNGITGGNVIFSISSQQQRSNDIYVVLWIWRTMSAQTHDQTYSKNLLYGKKSTILAHSERSDDDTDNISHDGPLMTADNVGLKPYLTPLCVSFAPLTHQGNQPSMKLTDDNTFTNDGMMTAMTHFLPPCSYHELFTNLIPSIQGQMSLVVTSRPSHVTQVDVLLQSHIDQLNKSVTKKYKGIPGWFLYQVQSFKPHLYETDPIYRAYSLYSDQVLTQKMHYLQLRDAIYDLQQFNETKYPTLQQEYRMMQQEMQSKKEITSPSQRRKSLMNGSRDNVGARFSHLSREPKSYLPLLVPELLPLGVAPASPFFTFVHTLYVYPFSVDFTKLRLADKPKLRPRNILLEITTREENGQTVSRIYPLHYAQANRNQLQQKYLCSVTYENKTPHFVDECKIELPLPIKSHNQRVVFNFYHLTIEKTFNKRKKSMDDSSSVPKVLFATCELSMLDLVNRPDQTQNLSLPLMKPNHAQLNAEEKYFDTNRNTFKLTTQIESTIFPRERALATFFKDCSPILNVIDKERTPNVDMKFISDALKKAIGAIKALLKIPFSRVVSHYTLIIDMLISVMCRTPDVLKNFVETMDDSSARPSSTGSNRSSGTKSRRSVAANRASVSVENNNRNRGSVKVDNTMPSIQLVLDSAQPQKDEKKNRFSVIANAFLRKSRNLEDESLSTATSPNYSGPKPGEEGFDLKEYLSKIQGANGNGNSSPSNRGSNQLSSTSMNRRNSGVFGRLRSSSSAKMDVPATSPTNDEKKKRRFSVFNFGAEKKKDEPAFTAIPDLLDIQLDELAERQSRRITSSEESSLSTDIGDFLSVSQYLFDLQSLAFQGLVTLLKGACYIEDTSSRSNKLISSYLQYIFKDVIMTTSPFCFILCESWTNLLSSADDSVLVKVEEQADENEEMNHRKGPRASSQVNIAPTNGEELKPDSYKLRMALFASEAPMFFESLNLCWFWFDMILKSFMITVETERKKTSFYSSHYGNAFQNYNKQADKLFILLKDLFKTLADRVLQYREENAALVESVNLEISNLLKDLLGTGMFPPSYIFQLLDTYLYALEEPKTRSRRRTEAGAGDQLAALKLKIAMFASLSEHPFFMALNNSVYHPSDYMKETLCCPPVKLLALCTQAVLVSKDEKVHKQMVNSLIALMSKFEQTTTILEEDKFAELRPVELQTTARVMFPFVHAMINSAGSIQSVDKNFMRDYSRCTVYLIYYLSPAQRTELLLGEKRKSSIRLLTIMLASLQAEDCGFIKMLWEIFLQLHEDENWMETCSVEDLPEETSFSKFLQSSSLDDPLAAYVVFFVASAIQKLAQVPDLKTEAANILQTQSKFVQLLIEKNIVSTNCYWRWLAASVYSNYTFSTQKSGATEYDQFLDQMLQSLHAVFGPKIGIQEVPLVTEEFTLPVGTKELARSSVSSPDEVSEFGVPINNKTPSPKESSELSTSSTDENSLSVDQPTCVEYENGVIRSGTLEQLVWRLVKQETVDNKYTDTFFLTYRSFCTPSQVLMHIISQFRHISQYSDRWHEFTVLRLLNSFKNWVTNHPYDFSDDLFANIFLFFKKDIVEYAHAVETIFIMPNMGTNPNTAIAYLATINRLKNNIVDAMYSMTDKKVGSSSENVFPSHSFSDDPPAPILPIPSAVEKALIATIDFSEVPMVDWSPVEIARQMTLIEYRIFSVIKPKECFNLGWSKSDKDSRSPNIVRLIEQFNKVSSWIATLIVKEDTPKKRGHMIRHWIDVAEECKAIGNLNGVNTIVSALNNSGIHRLKKSWECVSQKRLKSFKELTDFVSISGNYKSLRQAIQQINPPCVPYIGVYLTDLTFIEDGNKDVTKNNLINFQKRRQIARVIMNIRTLQQQPYNFKDVTALQQKLLQCEGSLDDSTLYKQSLVVEPRE